MAKLFGQDDKVFRQGDMVFGQGDKVEVQIAPKTLIKEKESVRVKIKTLTPQKEPAQAFPPPQRHIGIKMPDTGEQLQFEPEFERKLSFIAAWQKYLWPVKYEERWTKPDRAEKFHNAIIWPAEAGMQAMDSVLNRANKFVTAMSPVPELMKTAATLDPTVLYGIIPSMWEARLALAPKPGTADELRTFGETTSQDWYEPLAGEKPPDWYVPMMDIAFDSVLLLGGAAAKSNKAGKLAYSTEKLSKFEINAAKRLLTKSKMAELKPETVRHLLARESAITTLTKAEKASLIRRGYTPIQIQNMGTMEAEFILVDTPTLSFFEQKHLSGRARQAVEKMVGAIKGGGRWEYKIEGKKVSRKAYMKWEQGLGRQALEKTRKEHIGRRGATVKSNQYYENIIEAKNFMIEDMAYPHFKPPEITIGDYHYLLQSLRHSKMDVTKMQDTGIALMKILDGELPTKIEITLLDKHFGSELAKTLLAKHTKGEKVLTSIIDLANMPRSLLASMDLSFPLRQGSMLMAGHPVQWTKSFGQMMKSAVPFRGEKYARALENIAESSRWAGVRRNAGLDITDWGVATLRTREESALSTIAEKIPIIGRGVKWSNRTFTTMSNQLRINVFDSVARNWERQGMSWAANPEQYTKLATFLNHATGRGTIPVSWENQVPLLNAAFFSPKFVVSRFQIPFDAIGSLRNAPARKVIIKDLVAYVATGTTAMVLLSNLEGVSVEFDPRKNNFGKVRVGNTSYDFWGGNSQIARLITQAMPGIPSADDFPKEAREKIIGRFIRTKLSPAASLVYDLTTGKTFMGDEITTEPAFLKTELRKRVEPLVWQDIEDAVRFQGLDGLLPITSVAAFFGVGVGTWEPSKWELLSREQDATALETYGKEWNQLNEIQQILLKRDNELLVNLKREAAYERTVFPYLEEMQKEQLDAGFDVEYSLPDNVQTEMKRLNIRVGVLPRTWGQWTLNNKRYERFKTILALRLGDRLPKIIQSENWNEKTEKGQSRTMEGAIENAKAYSRAKLKIEVMNEAEGTPQQRKKELNYLETISLKDLLWPSVAQDPATISQVPTVIPTIEAEAPTRVPTGEEVPEEYKRLGVTRYRSPTEPPQRP